VLFCCLLLCVCSDDVDDQYTEKGRLLIRKEGEALAHGMMIGEILAADDLELQVPGLKGRKSELYQSARQDSHCFVWFTSN